MIFKAGRPSTHLEKHLPAAAIARLRSWEKKMYSLAGRDAKGKQVVDSLRVWMDKTRESPPDKRWCSSDFAGDGCRVGEGYEERLRRRVMRQLQDTWMREVLDKCTHHTMLCESDLGTMKHVTMRMGTAGIAARKAKVNACMPKTWEVYDRMSKDEQEVALYMSRSLLKFMGKYDSLCQRLHDQAAAERRFRDLREKIKEAGGAYAEAIVLHTCDVWTVAELEEALKECTNRQLNIDLLRSSS